MQSNESVWPVCLDDDDDDDDDDEDIDFLKKIVFPSKRKFDFFQYKSKHQDLIMQGPWKCCCTKIFFL